mmetsp:Transcript_31982/g.101789  ORF Transcript_31982/g.101789 Transcript_31982/m.101789 type:complete len:194 (-) Transcript_31982:728-1309(-)
MVGPGAMREALRTPRPTSKGARPLLPMRMPRMDELPMVSASWTTESTSDADDFEAVLEPLKSRQITTSTSASERNASVRLPPEALEAGGSERCKVGKTFLPPLGASARASLLPQMQQAGSHPTVPESSGKGGLLKAGKELSIRKVHKRGLSAGKFVSAPPCVGDTEPALPYLNADVLKLHNARHESQAPHRLP